MEKVSISHNKTCEMLEMPLTTRPGSVTLSGGESVMRHILPEDNTEAISLRLVVQACTRWATFDMRFRRKYCQAICWKSEKLV